jgi:ABC-type Na+ transport system ATPase subunit NatA
LQAFGKPTIDNIGVDGVNKKRVGQKEKGTQQKKSLAQALMLFLFF